MSQLSHTATLDLDVDDPAYVEQAISHDLQDSDRISFDIESDDTVHITVSAQTLGVLRGGMNTAMQLSKLACRFEVNDDE